ncbi:MAG: hypothetical protein K2Y08_02905 [Alphaproteobacteria bacterium]|nr:hypothetical protein [Alphaproteobacteria bacterium]
MAIARALRLDEILTKVGLVIANPFLSKHLSKSLVTIPTICLMGVGVFIPLLIASLFGISVKDCSVFFIYVCIYHGINGFLILSLLKQDWNDSIKLPTIFITGICYNIFTIFLLSFFHWQSYAFLNPLPLLLLNLIIKTNYINLNIIKKEDLLKSIILLSVLIIPFFIGSTIYTLVNPVNHHYTFQAAIASSITYNSYPYVNFLFPEVPLYYNYGYHLELAFSSLATQIPLEDLASRIYPLYIFFLLIWTSCSFCEKFIKGGIISGMLFAFFAYSVVGFYSPSSAFHALSGTSASINLVGSSTLAITIFFISTYKICTNRFSSLQDYLFIFMLFFIGAITRSAFPFILGGGLFFYGIRKLLQVRNLKSFYDFINYNKNLIIISLLLFLALVLSLVLVYGLFSSYTCIGFLRLVAQNSYFFTASSIKSFISTIFPTLSVQHPVNYNRLVAALCILLSANYLIPAFYYQVIQWFKNKPTEVEFFLIFCALSGCLIWNFTEASGGSNYTFFHYFYFIVFIFSASGVYLIFSNCLSKRSPLLILLTLSLLLSFSLKIYETYYSLTNLNSLSYRKPPEYAVSKNFLKRLSSININKDNLIIISLYRKPKLNDVIFGEILTTSSKTPVYHIETIQYGRERIFVQSLDIHKRMGLVKEALLKAEASQVFSDDTLNQLKAVFPEKSMLFIMDKTQAVKSSFITEIDTIDDMKLFLYTDKSFFH